MPDHVGDPADRRAEDQDAAIEEAFVAGTLPEDDRRAPADAGAAFYQDNFTTPHDKGGKGQVSLPVAPMTLITPQTAPAAPHHTMLVTLDSSGDVVSTEELPNV
jgi:hypothetical protein